jgi:hypothetical protein
VRPFVENKINKQIDEQVFYFIFSFKYTNKRNKKNKKMFFFFSFIKIFANQLNNNNIIIIIIINYKRNGHKFVLLNELLNREIALFT